VRDNADRMSASFENCVGDDAHQADGPAAEDETDATPYHLASKLAGRVCVDSAIARAGSAEHADTTER